MKKEFRMRKKIYVFLFLVGFIARLSLIFLRKHPAGDEVWALFLSQASFGDIWFAAFGDLHGPLYFEFLKVLRLLGLPLNLVTLRLISLFFDVLTSIVLLHLGNRLFGRRIGILIFCLSLFLPASIWAASFGRYYSLLIFLTLVSTSCFLGFLETRSRRMLFWLTLVTVLGTYTHYYFILLPISYLAFLIQTKIRNSEKLFVSFLISLGIAFLCLLPGIYTFFTLPKPELLGRHANSLLKIPSLLITNIISSETLIFLYFFKNPRYYIFPLLILCSMIGYVLVKVYRSWNSEYSKLFLSMFFVPLLVLIIFAYTVKPLLSLGSLQIFLPAFVVLLANGLHMVKRDNRIFILIFCLLIGISLYFLYDTSTFYSKPRKDFLYFTTHFQAKDLVLHSHLGSYLLASYYSGRGNNFEIASSYSVTAPTARGVGFVPISLEALTSHKGGVWYFESPYLEKSETEKIKSLLASRFINVYQETFSYTQGEISETYFNVYYFK